MVKYLVVISLFFLACTPEEAPEETGSIMEYKVDEDSLAVANGDEVERDLSTEPKILQDFFNLPPKILNDDFCYDRDKLLEVVVDGIEDEYGWHKFTLQEDANYFATSNYECYSEITFKTFVKDNKEQAFLSLSSKNYQEFFYLEKNDAGEWAELNDLPFEPDFSDFFNDLTGEEKDLVNEYGFYSIYMTSWGDTLDYVFSEWEMGLRMGEKEVDEFNKEADLTFSVTLSGDEFIVIQNRLNSDSLIVE